MTAIVTRPRRCHRCGIEATVLDRCGWCRLCCWEFAHRRVYVNWRLFFEPLGKKARLRL